VQVISNWYHNFPKQRTLLVTHSNQALNQLFEKIMALDIKEHHLLRLGHGEGDLETDKDFSKFGRVNHILERRMFLLEEIERLAVSLGLPRDVAHTCETAAHFFELHIVPRWTKFQADALASCQKFDTADKPVYKPAPKPVPAPPKKVAAPKPAGQEEEEEEEDAMAVDAPAEDPARVPTLEELFPFNVYFATAPQPLFEGKDPHSDIDTAKGCYNHLRAMFDELREAHLFEILKTGHDRSNYLITTQARIVAMTCTHAALKRKELVEMGFRYDNILMEEAAQILEIETFIPLLLQEPDPVTRAARLQRVVLIGDHNQLPPVVKNLAFQKYGRMDQSLFARFVRLGVPYIELDRQGRARASIAALYNWRYRSLGDLDLVNRYPQFQFANAGFEFDYQFINVEDFQGKGESEPNPHFFQNLGEAEYVVAMFQYMRLLGYPSEKISIITSYNGQKHLIRDVITQRCAANPLFGRPLKVTTVDRYQGQQNDFILLSLVRTNTVGHIRDVRRLVVAMSRARLGLLVFGRRSLFENCYELTNTFSQLLARPVTPQLVFGEAYPSTRPIGQPPLLSYSVADVMQMGQVISFLAQQRMVLPPGTPLMPPPFLVPSTAGARVVRPQLSAARPAPAPPAGKAAAPTTKAPVPVNMGLESAGAEKEKEKENEKEKEKEKEKKKEKEKEKEKNRNEEKRSSETKREGEERARRKE